jgi:hypothetical protein
VLILSSLETRKLKITQMSLLQRSANLFTKEPNMYITTIKKTLNAKFLYLFRKPLL